MKAAAVEPDVGYQKEHDGRHQGDMDAPDEGGGGGPPVAQDSAHSQLEEEKNQSNGGEPEAIGEARNDVASTQRWPGMPRRKGCKGQGKPVTRPEWQERRKRKRVTRPAATPDNDAV
jgi:hypothetical protein